MNERRIEEPKSADGSNICLYFAGRVDGGTGSIGLHVFVFGASASSPRGVEPVFPALSFCGEIAGGIPGMNRRLHELRAEADAVVFFVPSGMSFSAEDVRGLIEALSCDPFHGFAMPRVAGADERAIASRVAAMLPTHERRVVEGVPVLLRASVLRDFGLLDEQEVDVDAALARLFVRANRRGMSARRVNAVLLHGEGEAGGHRPPALARASDYAKALAAQAVLPELRFERLLSHRFADKAFRDVLFDIRNVAPGFNGTAHHVLALLDPLSRLAAQRKMRPHFWVLPESADFHGLRERYPESLIHRLPPDPCFDAAIRLTQPWSLTELRDQAHVSTVNVFSMLDTIAWDCHYIRMPHLEGVWRAMAEYADGFVFNSAFTRERFLTRFPEASGASLTVARCSMDPSEYWAREARFTESAEGGGECEPYVLIVGNKYYHKGLAEVVRALSSAFPEVRFKLLGEYEGQFHNVEQVASGYRSASEMARLFAECTCLVFPSFYEGFGLPIFEALAFGKPVLARHSDLIDEIRARIEPVSGLMSFVTANEMLRGLKSVLARQTEWRAKRSPAVLPRNLYRWENSAADILDLVDGLLARENLERCRKRLEFFYRLEMFDVERTGWTETMQNVVSFEVEKEE